MTTFHVLAADFNARSKTAKAAVEKGGKASYVPPAEKIEWWRIVLDEAHNIKGDTAQSKAALALHASRRWCVTGTPVNTAVDDLQASS